MQAPESFNILTSAYHQDYHFEVKSVEDFINLGVRRLSEEQRHELKPFLDELINGGVETAQKFWWASKAHVAFDDAGLMRLLKEIRAVLDHSPPESS